MTDHHIRTRIHQTAQLLRPGRGRPPTTTPRRRAPSPDHIRGTPPSQGGGEPGVWSIAQLRRGPRPLRRTPARTPRGRHPNTADVQDQWIVRHQAPHPQLRLLSDADRPQESQRGGETAQTVSMRWLFARPTCGNLTWRGELPVPVRLSVGPDFTKGVERSVTGARDWRAKDPPSEPAQRTARFKRSRLTTRACKDRPLPLGPAGHGATRSRKRMAWIGRAFMFGRSRPASRSTEATNRSRISSRRTADVQYPRWSSGRGSDPVRQQWRPGGTAWAWGRTRGRGRRGVRREADTRPPPSPSSAC